MVEDKKYWIALNLVSGIGKKTYSNLLEKFHTPENIFKASDKELSTIKKITPEILKEIRRILDSDELKKEFELIDGNNVQIITIQDELYPENLKEVPSPPPLLYVKGNLKKEDVLSLSIVGTRNPSEYGLSITREITRELAKLGITIISGLARGIDSEAHKHALISNGRTLAILGTGVNIIYPKENIGLAKKISENGALISEFPMSVVADKKNFPIRNATIAGLSLGTLVCEAPEKSGALITGKYSIDLGRELFAIPGNVLDSRYLGTNNLIKQGAKLVTCVDDILTEFSGRFSGYFKSLKSIEIGKIPMPQLQENQKAIIDMLTFEEQHLDEIALKLKKPVEKISSELFQLELMDLVKQLPGKMYIRLK
jgi:DNA processing protein